ncbi:protein of unknown function [Methylorubrum extorquens DM4]|uniref:Uncharacterized protein n=1 Tax=Methylorubrum extorquens (strain DSM 6343 / CIP 106787 / DM4) TaxID=661410 RepID=A0A2P9HAQ3_METED|nr:protein of unknown function [Methylorubrum extorquens DM4]
MVGGLRRQFGAARPPAAPTFESGFRRVCRRSDRSRPFMDEREWHWSQGLAASARRGIVGKDSAAQPAAALCAVISG